VKVVIGQLSGQLSCVFHLVLESWKTELLLPRVIAEGFYKRKYSIFSYHFTRSHFLSKDTSLSEKAYLSLPLKLVSKLIFQLRLDFLEFASDEMWYSFLFISLHPRQRLILVVLAEALVKRTLI
jgi:hypothetical protein